MPSVAERRILILLGTVVIIFLLGASALRRDFATAPAVLPSRTAAAAAITVEVTTTATASATPAPIASATASATGAPTATASATLTATASATATLTATATATATASATATATATRTQTPTPTATFTPWPTPDANARLRVLKVPILMYHYIGPLPNKPDLIRTGLTVLPDNFEQQLKFLQSRGYTAIDLYQLYYAITLGRPLPPKPVVFSFDDAYSETYDFALPIMQKYGFTGTVFVPTQFIDDGRADYMSWDQLMALRAAGWRLEPHTKTHENVAGRSRDWLIYQMFGSMDTLRYHLGYQPRFFAYPSGTYDDKAVDMLKEIGFWGAVTTHGGRTHGLSDAYLWTRVRIAGQYSLQDMANLLGEKYP